ncbi:hypothetical protein DUI87_23888 [Hirundo rustica rustica]|uniref:Uncharacterized protein n=1 Tax=Hirundo rustica rustica TaxID=333673 RepID=A0A3M0JF35_HIRRU|nr:hypothetical protein DUI87_23888 [Hirundo rustica rustica]
MTILFTLTIQMVQLNFMMRNPPGAKYLFQYDFYRTVSSTDRSGADYRERLCTLHPVDFDSPTGQNPQKPGLISELILLLTAGWSWTP